MWWLDKWMKTFQLGVRLWQELISTDSLEFRVWLPSLAISLKMALGGSRLNWVWEWSLGMVFKRTCSGELEEPFRRRSVLRPPSLLQNPWKRKERRITFRRHEPHCPWPSDCMHQQTLVHRLTLRTLLPNSASACRGEGQKRCRTKA